MKLLLKISSVIDVVTAFVGRAASWLVLVAVIISAGNAMIRYTFDTSSNAWLEAQWYLFGAVFLLSAAYTLQRNEHVRVDVIYNTYSKRTRNWLNLLGHIFMLMPFTLLLIYEAIPFVITSFLQQELSENANGLIRWPVKLLLLMGFMFLAAQGISEIIKRIAVMRGLIPDPHEVIPVESQQTPCAAPEQQS
jgi:TRAP-type mannitol/chloroaromatic compound transport system permease small subunit